MEGAPSLCSSSVNTFMLRRAAGGGAGGCILFSTLVFGPACGFILGSLCTKIYVDAVFIDTSGAGGVTESQQPMLPSDSTTAQDYEGSKPSNGVKRSYGAEDTFPLFIWSSSSTSPPPQPISFWKLNLSALGAVRMAMLVNLVSTACYVTFLFLGCDTGPVAGVTVSYGNEKVREGQKPQAACINNCNCYTASVSPVCGSNDVTYLSACFAGCTRANLTGCTCISSDSANATAMPGKCPSPGCQQAFLIFLCIICACSMIGAMAQTPSVIILIRTVSPELKSYALGVLFLLLRLLGFIPPPLIFGAGIDSTCLFWSTVCGEKGACMLYDNVAYRHLYVSIAIVLKVVAFLLYATTWQCLRKNYKKYIKNNEGYLTPTELFASNLTLDNAGKDLGQNPASRTKFIYNLEDHEWCENMESVL
ncbi:hypothetical protein JZ751_015840 [Albula glossodonta]|uniref:Kazal-like domain-containing protein n=1 Tax=Albula glossodonta TaxID=121402 RepID=A0A8T2N376_9TELE|nr:hypothetical protein JZ751_015840 [Albula glossodonta]